MNKIRLFFLGRLIGLVDFVDDMLWTLNQKSMRYYNYLTYREYEIGKEIYWR